MWNIETRIQGRRNYDNKQREATRFEEWVIRNFDQSELKRIGEIIGHGAAEGTNNNTVETDASYEGPTPDEKIIEKNTGSTSEQSSPENNPVVQKYKEKTKDKWYRKDSILNPQDAIYPDTMWTWYPNNSELNDTTVWIRRSDLGFFILKTK